NIAFCFFWLAAAVCAFFCAACLFTDFGDLSPIVGLLSATDLLACGTVSGLRNPQCGLHEHCCQTRHVPTTRQLTRCKSQHEHYRSDNFARLKAYSRTNDL